VLPCQNSLRPLLACIVSHTPPGRRPEASAAPAFSLSHPHPCSSTKWPNSCTDERLKTTQLTGHKPAWRHHGVRRPAYVITTQLTGPKPAWRHHGVVRHNIRRRVFPFAARGADLLVIGPEVNVIVLLALSSKQGIRSERISASPTLQCD
jgi:hypothetical protein